VRSRERGDVDPVDMGEDIEFDGVATLKELTVSRRPAF
jgi:hypothetical protein